MRNYLGFSWDIEDGGGWNDFVGDYDTLEEAVIGVARSMASGYLNFGEVVDTRTMQRITNVSIEAEHRPMTQEERTEFDSFYGNITVSGCFFNPYIVQTGTYVVWSGGRVDITELIVERKDEG